MYRQVPSGENKVVNTFCQIWQQVADYTFVKQTHNYRAAVLVPVKKYRRPLNKKKTALYKISFKVGKNSHVTVYALV